MRKVILCLFIATTGMAEIPTHTDYEYVAAGQTDQVCGPTGGVRDVLERVIIIPASVSPGAVLIEDGSETARTIFAGGTNSLTELKPIVVDIGARSRSGGWEITTGANVAAICVGRFK